VAATGVIASPVALVVHSPVGHPLGRVLALLDHLILRPLVLFPVNDHVPAVYERPDPDLHQSDGGGKDIWLVRDAGQGALRDEAVSQMAVAVDETLDM